MKKLLVLGSSGLTGYKTILSAKSRNFEVYGTFNARKVPRDTMGDDVGIFFNLDLNKENDGLKKAFSDIRPDVVMNYTALHNVDYCELNQQQAYSINSEVVGKMAKLCNTFGSRFIHISTDFVFDGQKGSSYVETDNPNPINLYAQSKLSGELEAKHADSYTVIRPSVIYGWTPVEVQGSYSSSGKPMNFGLWAINKMKNGEAIEIVDDQYSSPTLADTLASVCLRIAAIDKNEVYHVSGTSCISRYEFTRKIAEVMGYTSSEIKPIKSKNFKQKAQRPRNSCLNCEKVQRELKFKLPDIEQSLFVMRSQIELDKPSLLGN